MGARILAWSVHGYTALGLVLAGLAAVLIAGAGPGLDDRLRLAWVPLLLAVLIDATDGSFARRVRVDRVLPGFDGRRLDDIIDFHTYVSLPLLLLWRAQIPGEGFAWVLLLPLLAAAYGFGQTHVKTPEGFFLGFPSCWNVVAFYLFILAPPLEVTLLVLVGFSALTFVPIPYLYPTQGGPVRRTLFALGALWGAMALLVSLGMLPDERRWVLISLALPGFYLSASWWAALRGHSADQAGDGSARAR